MNSFMKMFRQHNVRRARTCFHHDTSEIWWTNAIAGECGEACNIAKKLSRGDFQTGDGRAEARRQIAIELIDVITYADLLLAQMGFDFEKSLVEKFNEVSARVGYPYTIESPDDE